MATIRLVKAAWGTIGGWQSATEQGILSPDGSEAVGRVPSVRDQG
ncbi:MAG: hypothetical protein ACO4AI_14930 [Prochlorothrix sp.]